MKAVITGAFGFVGRYLAGELGAKGYSVTALDIAGPEEISRPSAECDRLPEGIDYRKCDLLDRERLEEVMRQVEPEAVFHLAARSSGGKSFKDPAGTFSTNIMGFINLMEAVRKSRNEARVLAVGSCEEYGKAPPERIPLGEDSPIEPVNPYAASKAAQTILALQYHRAFGEGVIATRSFNHTGPGQTDTFVLPSFAKQCAAIKKGLAEPVISTGNLNVVRDFLDVRDVVRAYRLLMEGGKAGEVYNVCSAEGLNLREALSLLVEEAGLEVKIRTDPGRLRPVDVPVFTGKNQKLLSDTGWKRSISTGKMISDLLGYWMDKKVY